VKQIQEDLPQEQLDNQEDPEGKKAALKAILADYNSRYGTNHRLSEFDLYYQDVQTRIKDQQWPEKDLRKANPQAAHHKIDITIVVDMLLTGFDSKGTSKNCPSRPCKPQASQSLQGFSRCATHEIRDFSRCSPSI